MVVVVGGGMISHHHIGLSPVGLESFRRPCIWLWELVTSDKILRAHSFRATVIGQFLEARLAMELFQNLTHTMNLHGPENRKFLLTYYGHKYGVRSNLRRNCVIKP